MSSSRSLGALADISVGIDRRALIGRINRKLAESGKTFHVSRSPRMKAAVGSYFVEDETRQLVNRLRDDDELEEYARGLGLLAPYECLERA